MSGAALGLMAAGTILSAGSAISSGNAAARFGAAQQSSLDQQAGEVSAQGTALAAEQDMKTKYIISTLRARAAASGGSATDPTVENIAGAIAARGSYNTLSALYSSDEKATGLRYQGTLDNAAGQTKQQAGYVSAMGSILSGAGSMAEKYGSFGGGDAPVPMGIEAINPSDVGMFGMRGPV